MPKTKQQAAAMGGTPDEVEQAFYEALQRADLPGLMACWAEEDEIVCIQHGGPRLIGPGAIRSAFEALFAKGGMAVSAQSVHRIHALASAVHHLVEVVQVPGPAGPHKAWMIVTHVFHKTPQGWRLVAHHASLGTAEEVAQSLSLPKVLH